MDTNNTYSVLAQSLIDPRNSRASLALRNSLYGVVMSRKETTSVIYSLLGTVDSYFICYPTNGEKVFGVGPKIYARKLASDPLVFLSSLPFDKSAQNYFQAARLLTGEMSIYSNTISTTNSTLSGTVIAAVLPSLPPQDQLIQANAFDLSLENNYTGMLSLSRGARAVLLPNPDIPKFSSLTSGVNSTVYGGEMSWRNMLTFYYTTESVGGCQNNGASFTPNPAINSPYLTIDSSNGLPNMCHGDCTLRVSFGGAQTPVLGATASMIAVMTTVEATSVTDPTPVVTTYTQTLKCEGPTAPGTTYSGHYLLKFNSGDKLITSFKLLAPAVASGLPNFSGVQCRIAVELDMRDMIPAEVNNLMAFFIATGGETRSLVVEATAIAEVALTQTTADIVRASPSSTIYSSVYWKAVSEYLRHHQSFSFVGPLDEYIDSLGSGDYYTVARNTAIGQHTSFFGDVYAAAKDAGGALIRSAYQHRKAIGRGMMATGNPFLGFAGRALQLTNSKPMRMATASLDDPGDDDDFHTFTVKQFTMDAGRFEVDPEEQLTFSDDDTEVAGTQAIVVKIDPENEETDRPVVVDNAIIINTIGLGTTGIYYSQFGPSVLRRRKLTDRWPAGVPQASDDRPMNEHPLTIDGEVVRANRRSPLTNLSKSLVLAAKSSCAYLAHGNIEVNYICPHVINAYPIVVTAEGKPGSVVMGCCVAFNRADKPTFIVMNKESGKPELSMIPFAEEDYTQVSTGIYVSNNCNPAGFEELTGIFGSSEYVQQFDSVLFLNANTESSAIREAIISGLPVVELSKTSLSHKTMSVGDSNSAAAFTGLCGIQSAGITSAGLARPAGGYDVSFTKVGSAGAKQKAAQSLGLVFNTMINVYKTSKHTVNGASDCALTNPLEVRVRGCMGPKDILCYGLLIQDKEIIEKFDVRTVEESERLSEDIASLKASRARDRALPYDDRVVPATQAINFVVSKWNQQKLTPVNTIDPATGMNRAPNKVLLLDKMAREMRFENADLIWKDKTWNAGEFTVSLVVGITRIISNNISGKMARYMAPDGVSLKPFDTWPSDVQTNITQSVVGTQRISKNASSSQGGAAAKPAKKKDEARASLVAAFKKGRAAGPSVRPDDDDDD